MVCILIQYQIDKSQHPTTRNCYVYHRHAPTNSFSKSHHISHENNKWKKVVTKLDFTADGSARSNTTSVITSPSSLEMFLEWAKSCTPFVPILPSKQIQLKCSFPTFGCDPIHVCQLSMAKYRDRCPGGD